MNVALSPHRPANVHADLLVIPAFAGQQSADVAQLDQSVHGKLAAEIRRQRFHGAADRVVLFQTHGARPVAYVLVVGMGEGEGPTPWYKLAHAAVTHARDLYATSAALAIPSNRSDRKSVV